MKPLLIVDIDGTVCDSEHFVKELNIRFNKNVDCWNDKQVRIFLEEASKKQVLPGALILSKMFFHGMCDVIFLTGRSEKVGRSNHLGRRLTIDWLHKVFGMPKDIPLFMRPPDDGRIPSIIKFEVFEKFIFPKNKERIFIFLDDDVKVLKLYSNYGLALKSPECWKAIYNIKLGG